jgi:hypothetical protein
VSRRPWVRRNVGEQRLWVWMPYQEGSNRRWILEELGERIRPEWNNTMTPGRWEIARPHLRTIISALAERLSVCGRADPDALGRELACEALASVTDRGRPVRIGNVASEVVHECLHERGADSPMAVDVRHPDQDDARAQGVAWSPGEEPSIRSQRRCLLASWAVR